MDNYAQTAHLFRSLHKKGSPLLLPNAWDVASARVIEKAGAAAIATASAGVSWSLGRPDGEGLDRGAMLDAVARIAEGAGVPVSADIEGGYGAAPADVADTVREVVRAGAVGINLEDGGGDGPEPLRSAGEQSERIAAAREASAELFIHARVDVFLRGVGAEETRIGNTVERAQAYRAAGADGIFVPGVTDPALVAQLAEAIEAPLGVLAHPGSPPVAELAAAGAARISQGPALASAAYALAQRSVRELLEQGTYTEVSGGLSFPEMNALLAR